MQDPHPSSAPPIEPASEPHRFTRCPKCGQMPLPLDQGLPAACPARGVILAKVGALPPPRLSVTEQRQVESSAESDDAVWWLPVRAQPLSRAAWLTQVLIGLGFAAWTPVLWALDHRTGEIGSSFLHGPLLIFHEAGHVLLRPFGEWLSVMGGSLGQLAMPALMGACLLRQNRDAFGAALALWLFGASVLDLAPYVYDAFQPQLMLLSGHTGEEGGHDWIYLLSSMGWLQQAQLLGTALHRIGALTQLIGLAWAARALEQQRPES